MKILAILILTLVLVEPGYNQAFYITVKTASIVDTINAELYFEGTIVNESSDSLNLALVRSRVILPDYWDSAICFMTSCFHPSIDSVATTETFGHKPIPPGMTKPYGLHVFMNQTYGTGYVDYTFINLKNLNERNTITFTASTLTSAIFRGEEQITNDFQLTNFPNPFNSNTKINFKLSQADFVQLSVFDLLGSPIAKLIDTKLMAGSYEIPFSSERYDLSSGTYFYVIKTTNRNIIRKMILVK